MYIKKDLLALGIKPKYYLLFNYLTTFINLNCIVRFQMILRTCEYMFYLKQRSILLRIFFLVLKWFFKRLSIRLGFSIPLNVFGHGLAIIHYGTIVVNQRAKVGNNCRIHVCTNIGESGGVSGAPFIGDNVYIGPGAKIYGNISIADNIAIAANAAVSKSFLNQNKVIGGIPAREIGSIDIKQLIKHI